MGVIGMLVKMTRGKLGIKGNAPGDSVIAQSEGLDGQVMNAEVYQAPGVLAIPGDGSRGVWIPVGGSNRYGVVVAMQNYALNIEINAGETAIYSTGADGQSVQALIKLKSDGTIELNGDGKNLVTGDELQTALSTLCGTLTAHTHPGNNVVSPGLVALACDITAAKTTTLKTDG